MKSCLRTLRASALFLLLFLLRALPAAGQDLNYTPPIPQINQSITQDVPLPTLSASGGAPLYEWTGSDEEKDNYWFDNDPANPPIVTYETLDGKQGAVINLGHCVKAHHYPGVSSAGLCMSLDAYTIVSQGVEADEKSLVTTGSWKGGAGTNAEGTPVIWYDTYTLGTDAELTQNAYRHILFNNKQGQQTQWAEEPYLHKTPTVNEWALRNSVHIKGTHSDVTGVVVSAIPLNKVILDNLVLPCDGSQDKSLTINTGVPWWATSPPPQLDIQLIGTNRLEGVNGLYAGSGSGKYSLEYYVDEDQNGDPDLLAADQSNWNDVIKVKEIAASAENQIARFTLHGDSLIARFPKTGKGEYYEHDCGRGISFNDNHLTIKSCYLEVQGHVQASTITVQDGVVTAVDPVWIDDYHKPTTPRPMRGFWANETIIDGGSVKVDSFFVSGGQLSIENPSTLVTPKNSDGEPVYRVAFAHRGATAVTVTPAGGTAVTRNLRFHHPDDDNYYFFLPNGDYTLAVAQTDGADKDTAYTVTVADGPNDTHKSGVAGGPPVETGPGPLTPDLDGGEIIELNIRPTWRFVELNEEYLYASLPGGDIDTTIDLTKQDPDYYVKLIGGSYDPTTKAGTTFFYFLNNPHRVTFKNAYLSHIVQPKGSNENNSFRRFNFSGINTIWRGEDGLPFTLESVTGQPDGARFTGDSLTCGFDTTTTKTYTTRGAFSFGGRGSRLIEFDMGYLHLWGGTEGGITTSGEPNDTVRIKRGVVTVMSKGVGIACTERVIVSPFASLKSENFTGTITGSGSMTSTGGHPVQPVNEDGNPVYCVRVPHNGGTQLNIALNDGTWALQVTFTSHHPNHDPSTGAPIAGTDPYYYIYLPNTASGKNYRFFIGGKEYKATVKGFDTDATLVGDITGYAHVHLGAQNGGVTWAATRDMALIPQGEADKPANQIVFTDMPDNFFLTGGEKDGSTGGGLTNVNIQKWKGESAILRNVYARTIDVRSFYVQSEEGTVYFYEQNTFHVADEENIAVSVTVPAGKVLTLKGDSLTGVCSFGNSFGSGIGIFDPTGHKGCLALELDYVYARGPHSGILCYERNANADPLRINSGVVTSVGEDFGVLQFNGLVIGEKASFKAAAIDGSATGRNALVKKLVTDDIWDLERRKEVAEMLVPRNAAGDTLYCVSVPHGGALTLGVTPEGGSAYSVSFKAHHPQHDADGLPVAGKVDPNYYLWLPKGTYSITAGAKVFAATVEEADVLAEDVTPPPPAGGGGGEGPSGGGGGGGGGTATRYVVTFTDGTDILIRFTVTKGSRIPTDSIPALEREGYTLLHWYSGADIENAWDFETPVSSVLTLSPCWIPYVEPTPDDPDDPDALLKAPSAGVRISREGDYLRIATPAGQPITALQLSDVTGRIRQAERGAPSPFLLPLAPHPAGAYFLRVTAGEDAAHLKFIR